MLNISQTNPSSSLLHELNELDDHLKQINLNFRIQWFDGIQRKKEITPISRVVTFIKSDGWSELEEYDLRFEDEVILANEELNKSKKIVNSSRKINWNLKGNRENICSVDEITCQFPKLVAKLCFPDDSLSSGRLEAARQHYMRTAIKALIKAKRESLASFKVEFFEYFQKLICQSIQNNEAKKMIKDEVQNLSQIEEVLVGLCYLFFSHHLDRIYAEIEGKKLSAFSFNILKELIVLQICQEKSQPSGVKLDDRIQNVLNKIVAAFYDSGKEKHNRGLLRTGAIIKTEQIFRASKRDSLLYNQDKAEMVRGFMEDCFDSLAEEMLVAIFRHKHFEMLLQELWGIDDKES